MTIAAAAGEATEYWDYPSAAPRENSKTGSGRSLRVPLFVVIDTAARPAIYFRHVEAGRFVLRSGNSARSKIANS
jgi:hypothetical protein